MTSSSPQPYSTRTARLSPHRRRARRLIVGGLTGGLAAGLATTGLPALLTAASAQDLPASMANSIVAQSAVQPSALPDAGTRSHRASRSLTRAPLKVAVPTKTVTREVAVGATFSGGASWYGGQFQGRRTASGERFNTYDLTAASKTLAFGTRVRVCRDSRCVVVRINDRGPYVSGRVLDLSLAAAQQLGYSGVAQVTATPIAVRTETIVDRPLLERRQRAARRAALVRAVAASHRAALERQQAQARAALLSAAETSDVPGIPLDTSVPWGTAAGAALGAAGLRRPRRTAA